MGKHINRLPTVMIYILCCIVIISCSKKDDPKDCNCNRVTDVVSFNLALPPPNDIVYYYSTVNDCSGVKKIGIPSNTKPIDGECRK